MGVLVSEILTQVRGMDLLNDLASNFFPDSKLLPIVPRAWRRLVMGCQNQATPRVKKFVYFNLPTNTTQFPLHLSGSGLESLDVVELVEGRGGITEFPIATIALDAPTATAYLVVVGTHNLAAGGEVVISGTRLKGLDELWGVKSVTPPSGVTVGNFIGLAGSSTYTSGGKLSTSGELFVPLYLTELNPTTGFYSFRDNKFFFPPFSEMVQIRILGWHLGPGPQAGTDEIEFDSARDFLATYIAALAAQGVGALKEKTQALMYMAVGNFPDNPSAPPGGLLGSYVRGKVFEKQQDVLSRTEYRPQGNPRGSDPYGW